VVCFGIVAASFVVLVGAMEEDWPQNILYQSLLVARPDINDRTTVLAMPRNHAGSPQLWTSYYYYGLHISASASKFKFISDHKILTKSLNSVVKLL